MSRFYFLLPLSLCLLCSMCLLAQMPPIDHKFKNATYTVHYNEYCYAETGEMKIFNVTDTRFQFKINVGNSSGAAGGIDGTATIYGPNHGYWQEPKVEAYQLEKDFNPAVLNFYLSPDKKYIFLTAESTSYFHGMQVCFDGYYELKK